MISILFDTLYSKVRNCRDLVAISKDQPDSRKLILHELLLDVLAREYCEERLWFRPAYSPHCCRFLACGDCSVGGLTGNLR